MIKKSILLAQFLVLCKQRSAKLNGVHVALANRVISDATKSTQHASLEAQYHRCALLCILAYEMGTLNNIKLISIVEIDKYPNFE